MKAKLYFCTEQQHRTKQQQKPLNFPAESARTHTARVYRLNSYLQTNSSFFQLGRAQFGKRAHVPSSSHDPRIDRGFGRAGAIFAVIDCHRLPTVVAMAAT